MAHVTPLPYDELDEAVAEQIPILEAVLGFVPNSILTVARRPELLHASLQLISTTQRPFASKSGMSDLGALLWYVSSRAVGCQYSQAHAAAVFRGDPQRLESVWEFEQSEIFSPAERAAFRLAVAAAQVPNQVTTAHFEDLREHYDDNEIVDIVAMISLTAWANRWNDTMATTLEDVPFAAASAHLPGWVPGRSRDL